MHIKQTIKEAVNIKTFDITENTVKNDKDGEVKKKPWNYETVKQLLLVQFEENEGVPFIETPENLLKLKTIVYYLTRDKRFFNSPLLKMQEQSKPSFDKGLLIVGGYGTGKSALLKAMSDVVAKIHHLRATYHLCSEMVAEYESMKEAEDIKQFMDKHFYGTRIYDDLLNEDVASNYGKKDILKDIFTARYKNKRKTHTALNYHPDYPGDVEMALQQIGERYGGHIYDRIFQMFNIIEFPGKSMRC
ncbi:P-loop NTPase family protein [Aestuariibaculum sediminum]|uniref:ATPase n=1 Tax=Aestuariibaculum sediminum TaxID=2770637 RepID=A0A8J6PZA1_9FLAO|nr:hypothetical protein [Aestuariibaculum sediminum]MBD0831818.1 hypothetical protein [Aestuariibaculum sediminum]